MEAVPYFVKHLHNKALIENDWKLVQNYENDWSLYSLKDDRVEQNDLASEHPDFLRELQEKWGKWAWEKHVYPKPQPKP